MIYVIERYLVPGIWELFGEHYFVNRTKAEELAEHYRQEFQKMNKKEQFRITPLEVFNK